MREFPPPTQELLQRLHDGFDLGSMGVASHAAAPCPIEVKEIMINGWGPIIVEYSATSESIGFTLIDSPTWLCRKVR